MISDMGVKVFRDDNWKRIIGGDISRRDIMGLDEDKDRELIGYLSIVSPVINTDGNGIPLGAEEDRDVLTASLHDSDHSVAAFAFCRLTGYSFTPDECDAYSYRTFSCDILPGTTADYREAIWDCWISIISS